MIVQCLLNHLQSHCYCLVCPTLATPWTIAHQAPLSMGFPRQEYLSGSSFPSPGALPDPGIQPASPALAGGFFTTGAPGKPHIVLTVFQVLYSKHINSFKPNNNSDR